MVQVSPYWILGYERSWVWWKWDDKWIDNHKSAGSNWSQWRSQGLGALNGGGQRRLLILGEEEMMSVISIKLEILHGRGWGHSGRGLCVRESEGCTKTAWVASTPQGNSRSSEEPWTGADAQGEQAGWGTVWAVWAGQCRGDRDGMAALCIRVVLKALLMAVKKLENS